jgi:hypothetical protein
MTENRLRIPVGLIIAIAMTLILGLAASLVINALTIEKQRATNALLFAIPFILLFVSILLAFISLINMSTSVLNNYISARIFLTIKRILIAGIVLGVFDMFKPWLMIQHKVGFMVLLVSTLGFIWWSHLKPKNELCRKEAGCPSIEILKVIET